MKKLLMVISIMGLLVLTPSTNKTLLSQCVTCSDNIAIGKASAIGTYSFADGNSAFASGYQSRAEGDYSFASGYSSIALGKYSFASGRNNISNRVGSQTIGAHLVNNGNYSILIGEGFDNDDPLVNNIHHSIMMGTGSTVPTFYISPSESKFDPGKVGIGTTNPQTDLHVEGSFLTKEFYYPTANAQSGYVLTYSALGKADWKDLAPGLWEAHGDNIYRLEGKVGIGTEQPLSKFQIGDKWTFNDGLMKSIGYNLLYAYEKFYTMQNGPGALINFEPSGAISFWTAPSGSGGTPVDDMTEAIIISNNGYMGIGTRTPEAPLHVDGKIKTSEFQLINNQMAGRILQCDFEGNASWIDPAEINDGDWILNGTDIYVTDDFKVGIGTNAPAAPLHLVGDMLAEGNIRGNRNSWQSFGIYANNNEDDGSYITMAGNVGDAASIKLYCKGSAGRIEFHHDGLQVMSIRANHNVYIGDPNNPSTLYVNGDIETSRIRTSLETWWDDVLKPGYDLMSLSELENYINQNHHLPDMPSEEEVLQDGIDLGEMNALLLKKVEELTLHVIALEKEVVDMKANCNTNSK